MMRSKRKRPYCVVRKKYASELPVEGPVRGRVYRSMRIPYQPPSHIQTYAPSRSFFSCCVLRTMKSGVKKRSRQDFSISNYHFP
jgi:hypothetical protein